MALTQTQINQLNQAAQRVASGTGSDADKKNLSFAQRQGYTPSGVNNKSYYSNIGGYSYLNTMDAVNSAIKQYGKNRVKNIAGDYFVIPQGLNMPNPKSPIPAGNLNNYAEISRILGRQVTQNDISPEIAGLLALQGQTSQQEKDYNDLNARLAETMASLGSQGSDLQAEFEKQGVNSAFERTKELNLRAAQLQGELQQFDVATNQASTNLADQPIPSGLIQGQQARLQQQRDITRMGKAAELSSTIALSQAFQGNANLGLQLAQQAVDMKYQPILNNIEVLRAQIGIAGEKMSREDKKRADILNTIFDEKQKQIQEKKDKEKQIFDIALNAAAAGAPLDLVNQIKGAKDAITAAALAYKFTPKTGSGGGGRGSTDKDDGIPASEGFATLSIERDARATAEEYSTAVALGEMTKEQAFQQMRRLYSNNEVSTAAIYRILGDAPTPTVGDRVLGPTNPKTRVGAEKDIFNRRLKGDLIGNIQNFLFKRK